MPRPGMSDGRALTDWRPNCELNHALKQQFEIKSDSEYRSYLQNESPVVVINKQSMTQEIIEKENE